MVKIAKDTDAIKLTVGLCIGATRTCFDGISEISKTLSGKDPRI